MNGRDSCVGSPAFCLAQELASRHLANCIAPPIIELLIRHFKSLTFVIPGLTRNAAIRTSARFARHWIPAFAGMTLLLY